VATLPRRTFLARRTGLGAVERFYRTRDAIEVDELEGYDVTRRRVLFDEVILATYHREVGWAFVVTMLILLTFVGFFTMIIAIADFKSGVVATVFFVLPILAALVLRLALRVDVVTVHGPRTRARIPFWFQKDRARAVFRLVCRLAREHQDRRAQTRAARSPNAPPPAGAPPGPPGEGPPPGPAA
jgi:hypothetical protein